MSDFSGSSIQSIPSSYRPTPEGALTDTLSLPHTHDCDHLKEHGTKANVTIVDYSSEIGAVDQPQSLAMELLRLLRNFSD